MLEFIALAGQCAPEVNQNTLAHLVQIESAYNPFAIGIVGARLQRQPQNLREALATATWLQAHHYNFSVGLGQVNQSNLQRYGLTLEAAFEPCRNLQASAAILTECYLRAYQARSDEQAALRDSLSCYYSGNFTTGYRAGYVAKVIAAGTVGPSHHQRAHATTQSSGPASALLF